MSKDSVIDTRKLDKQLDKTEKIAVRMTRERENLKQLFKQTYKPTTVIAILELIMQCGIDNDKKFASNFKKHYSADNYDESEIRIFKNLLRIYADDIEKIIGEEDCL